MTFKEQMTRTVAVAILTVIVSRTLDFAIRAVKNRFLRA